MSTKSPKNPDPSAELSRRKRQILDILYVQGKADVQQVLDRMHDAPSYSAVRTTLNLMVDAGVLTCEKVSRKYVYAPARSRTSAAGQAARHMLATFFGGSVSQAVRGLMDASDGRLPPGELDALMRVIKDAKAKENP